MSYISRVIHVVLSACITLEKAAMPETSDRKIRFCVKKKKNVLISIYKRDLGVELEYS